MKSAFINHGTCSVKELPLHRNMGMELVYISEGVLNWVVDGRVETLYPDTLFFTLPWQVHGSEVLHEPGNCIQFVQLRLDQIYRKPVSQFSFHPNLDIPPAPALRLSRIFCAATCHTWSASQDLKMIFPALLKKLERGADPFLLQGYARTLLAELAGMITGEIPADVYRPEADQRVMVFLQTLRARCEDPWTLNAMARACSMGRSLFSDTTRRLTGDAPMTHLRRLRIEQAKKLLTQSTGRITDIAIQTGFSTTQLFARTFKEFTNMTPTHYRQQAQHPETPRIIDFSDADEQQRHTLIARQAWL